MGLYLHFTTNDYDYFKSNGAVRASKESFALRSDKYVFHKLVRKYPNDLEQFFLAQLVYTDAKWVNQFMSKESDDNYRRFLKNQQAITNVFKNDLSKMTFNHSLMEVIDGQNPALLVSVYRNQITIETLILLDIILPFLNEWNSKITDTILWPSFYKKCVKFKPFLQKLNIEKFKKIAKDIITDQS